jgi:hypothetical protein
MKYVLCLVVCCFVIGIGIFVSREPNKKTDMPNKITENKSHRLPKFASMKNDERMRLIEQLSKERVDFEGQLLVQLDKANPKEVTFAVVFLLGFNRMEAAVGHLSPLITLEADITDNNHIPWGRYPVAEALIRIGGPAIPEMIKSIETSDDQKVRDLSAEVICYVDGPEIAIFRLEKLMDKQADSGKKARLKAAVKHIQTLPN